MNSIPTTDYRGNKVRIGDKAIMFSRRGIAFVGTIKQIGGKRWFEVRPGFRIGGLGSNYMLKD